MCLDLLQIDISLPLWDYARGVPILIASCTVHSFSASCVKRNQWYYVIVWGHTRFLSLVLYCICNSQVQIVTETVEPQPMQGPDDCSDVDCVVRGYGWKFIFIQVASDEVHLQAQQHLPAVWVPGKYVVWMYLDSSFHSGVMVLIVSDIYGVMLTDNHISVVRE